MLAVGTVFVEIAAVRAGMGKNAVQKDADAALFRRRAQGAQVRLRSEGGIDLHVIARIVFVVGGRTEDGVQVQNRHAQAFDIGKLFLNAAQIAAEEVVGGALLCVQFQVEIRPVVPVFVVIGPGGEVGGVFFANAAETVHHDLHHRGFAHPGGAVAGGIVNGDLVTGRLAGVDQAGAVAVIARVAIIQRRGVLPAQGFVYQRGRGQGGAQRVLLIVFEDKIVPQTAGILRQRGFAGEYILAGAERGGVRAFHAPGTVLGKERGIEGHARHGHPPFAAVLPQPQGCGTRAVRPHREAHRFTRGTRAPGKAEARVAGIVKDHSSRGSRRQIFWLYSAMVRSAAKMPLLAVLTIAIFSHRSRSR